MRRASNAINDFRYGEAATAARQVLALGARLSRQQRISALQTLTAAIYPDDKSVQRPDSAKVLMRHLVRLGLVRGIPRSIAWPGLDSLYAVVRAEPPSADPSVESQLRDSLPAVLALLSEKLPPAEVIDRTRLDCDFVSFDSVDAALARVQAPSGLGQALRAACAQVVVQSDPVGATVTLADRKLGVVAARRSWWVNPVSKTTLTANLGARQVSTDLTLDAGKSTEATFVFGESGDTLPVPLIPTVDQVVASLDIMSGWRPSSSRPAAPKKPKTGRSLRSSAMWGAGGLVLGGAVAFLTSAPGCYQKVPSGEFWLVKGKVYAPGSSVGTPSCAAVVAIGTGGVAFGVSRFLGRGTSAAAQQQYDREMAEYPAVLKRWEDQDKAAFASRNPSVRRVIAESQASAMRIRAHNDSIRSGTAASSNVRIVVTDLGLADFVAGTASISDIDTVSRRSVSPNEDAVAVVIGNRSYASGTPANELAVRDAKSVRNYLVNVLGFKPDRVVMDSNATAARMGALLGTENNETTSQLADLVASRPPGTADVIVYFNGFGTAEGSPQRGYLLPVDATVGDIATKGIALEPLFRNLAGLNARSVTVLLETSFASESEYGPIFAGRSSSVGGTMLASARQHGIDVFAAAASNQVAHTRPDQSHGLFTYFVLKGLQGSADRNGDRSISVDELAAYVRQAMPAWELRAGAPAQTPDIVTVTGDRAMVRFSP